MSAETQDGQDGKERSKRLTPEELVQNYMQTLEGISPRDLKLHSDATRDVAVLCRLEQDRMDALEVVATEAMKENPKRLPLAKSDLRITEHVIANHRYSILIRTSSRTEEASRYRDFVEGITVLATALATEHRRLGNRSPHKATASSLNPIINLKPSPPTR